MPLTPLDRKIALLRAGVSMAEIGRQLGVTKNHVAMVVAGKRRSPRVEAKVAESIGKPTGRVFPPAEVHAGAA